MSDEYKTIIGIATGKHVVKKSRFFGEASAVNSHVEVKDFINNARTRLRQATHYCYAYRLGKGSEIIEFATDAGEPKHSAGPPILSAIRAAGLTNTAIVVARYYGGIKLGVRGLNRAYGACARECLNEANLQTLVLTHEIHVNVPHSQIGTVVTLCKRSGGKVKNIQYDPNPVIVIKIRHDNLDTFQAQLKTVGITKTKLL